MLSCCFLEFSVVVGDFVIELQARSLPFSPIILYDKQFTNFKLLK